MANKSVNNGFSDWWKTATTFQRVMTLYALASVIVISAIVWAIAGSHDVDTIPPDSHGLTKSDQLTACVEKGSDGRYTFREEFFLSIPCDRVQGAEAVWETFAFRDNAPLNGAIYSVTVNGGAPTSSSTVTVRESDYRTVDNGCEARVLVSVSFTLPNSQLGDNVVLIGYLNDHAEHGRWRLGRARPGESVGPCVGNAPAKSLRYFRCLEASDTHDSQHVHTVPVRLCNVISNGAPENDG